MIRLVTGWFHQAPPRRTAEQLADVFEANPGGLVTLHPGEDLWAAGAVLAIRREKADDERRRRMRGGIDIPGLP